MFNPLPGGRRLFSLIKRDFPERAHLPIIKPLMSQNPVDVGEALKRWFRRL